MKELADKKILMVSYTSFLQKFYQTLPHKIALLSNAQVKVLVPPYWKELWSGGKSYLEKDEDPLYDLHVGKILFAGNLHFALFRQKLVYLLKKFQPDIIDLEDEPFNAGTFQMALYRNWFSPRSKIVLHASQHQFKQYPPPFNFMEKFVLKRSEAILVRNEMAKDVLRRKGYPGILEIVTHGVNVDGFRPREAPELRQKLSPNGKPIVGYVGALVEHKGLRYLIRAVKGLDCKLVLVGDGADKSNLEKLSQELSVDAGFIPPVSHEKITQYFNTMDIFVLPSLTKLHWVEKFGRVLIEAMASGVPVIGSNSGEIPNVLGDAGLIFREANETDLRDKIQSLLGNPERRREMSKKGRARTEKMYSWEAIAAKTIKVYKKVLY